MEADDTIHSDFSMIAPPSIAIQEHRDHDDERPASTQPQVAGSTNSHEDYDRRIPPFDPNGPTALPLASSSILSSELGDESQDIVNEAEMTRHLMDMESSLAGSSPWPGRTSNTDDLPHFDTSNIAHDAPSPGLLSHKTSSLRPSQASQAQDYLHSDMTDPTTTSTLETMSSSPTAAAAARTVSRAISMASMGYDVGGGTSPTSEPAGGHATPRNRSTPRIETNDDVNEDFTLDQETPLEDEDHFVSNAGHTPGAALLKRNSSSRRPKFLRSRHASQRSSVSSSIANMDLADDGSEGTLGADYALQSGGAMPTNASGNSLSLSRSMSLGSMASGFEDYSGDTLVRSSDQKLATLDEEERGRQSEQASLDPRTPRPSRSLAPPTDTVIARHVRNVQVPDSVVKEYRNKNRVASPERATSNTSMPFSRSNKNLTLKEQSSIIEKLSKENFDLKLKVMFLSDRLDKLSEEGMKEMISENVELKTGLAVLQRDNKALRRKVKDLEKKLKDEEDRPSTAHSTMSGDGASPWSDQEGAQEREEELLYLRERVEEYEAEMERLRDESLIRENDKRKLAEALRSVGERRGDYVETREETEVWKDLLEQETARREQADEDNRKLREEIFRLRSEATGLAPSTNTTNIYHISKKRQVSPSRPRSVASERFDERSGAISSATTLVEELRRESEQLRHENAELRREVGAQTSMLTSRNREKERLYQEIEDLKLGQRRGTSVAGDSILERSASRAHERSHSRGSIRTKQTGMSDDERDELENKNAELRDQLNSLKIQNQELQRELDAMLEELEGAIEVKKDTEALSIELQEDLDSAIRDLQAMQIERDEALRGQESVEIEFEALRKEAQEEIDALEAELEDRNADYDRLQNELADRTENFAALQGEMRTMSESVIKLEDAHEASLKRIGELEREIRDREKELEQYEKNLVEANSKLSRTSVQLETSQGECAFLREEQENDKMNLGKLENDKKIALENLQEERERNRELEQRISAERKQRELLASKEKQEIQKFINDLNRQVSTAKDEASKLRKNLNLQEIEATSYRERLHELENNLRETLGDLNGTRSSFIKSIAQLQRDIEDNNREMDAAKAAIIEKDRTIKQRDALLESHSLETGRLGDMLDKERLAHRATKHQFEAFQKNHHHVSRTATQQEMRVSELESSRQQDRKRIASLENAMKDQLLERNNLLLTLWNRLSTLCGSDWAHNNSLINGRALPSLEALGTMLPGFSKNLLAAVKTIEILIGNFNQRIRTLERDLTKEYNNIEHQLEIRTKRIEKLETVFKNGVPAEDYDRTELAKLSASNRVLKTELKNLRALKDKPSKIPTSIIDNDAASSPSPSVPMGPRSSALDVSRHSLSRNNTTALETLGTSLGTSPKLDRSRSGGDGSGGSGGVGSSGGTDESGEQRWIFRLRELERRLKAEREARLLDRDGARKRLEEGERRNKELRAELERNKIRKETALH